MARKPHKKSRFGCANCKKRHQKCDESKPFCVNCRTAGTVCDYTKTSSNDLSGSGTNPRASIPIDGLRVTSSGPLYLSPAPPRTSPSPSGTTLKSSPGLDLTHFALFHRYLQDPQQIFGFGFEDPEEGQRLMLKYALKCHYLMSLVLAVTALRQIVDRSSNVGTKLHEQSTALFSRGIRELNTDIEHIDEGNIGYVFLASSLTGKYMLCDTFIVPRQESRDAFLDRIINTIRVARGVRAVMEDGHWMMLASSELRPMLGFNAQDVFELEDHDDEDYAHFVALYDIVQYSTLSADERTACQVAITQLTRSYGSKSSSLHLRRASRFIRGRAWPVATTPLFTEMLKRRVPEALVILAHWSVLLHYISDIWAIGDAANLLVNCVSETLGTGTVWHNHLGWVKDFISQPVLNRIAGDTATYMCM